LGNIEQKWDHMDKAREYFALAQTEAQDLAGEDALELAPGRANVEIASGNLVRADEILVGAVADLAHALGEGHPDTLSVRWLRGSSTIEDLRQAEEFLTRLCPAYALHAEQAARMARCWSELGLVRWDLGDRERARAAMKQAMAVPD